MYIHCTVLVLHAMARELLYTLTVPSCRGYVTTGTIIVSYTDLICILHGAAAD